MVRIGNSMDHRMVLKFALVGALAQIILIPFFIFIGTFFSQDEGAIHDGDARHADAQSVVELGPATIDIHDPDGSLNTQRMIEVVQRNMYRGFSLQSFIVRGKLTRGNGVICDYTLMRSGAGHVREISESGHLRTEFISDGKQVRRDLIGSSKRSQNVAVSGENNAWLLSRLAVGTPLAEWPALDDDVSVEFGDDGRYRLLWMDGGSEVNVWVSPDRLQVDHCRITTADGQEVTVTFGDFREVGLCVLPHQIQFEYSDSRFTELVDVEAYQFNPGLSPSLFTP